MVKRLALIPIVVFLCAVFAAYNFSALSAEAHYEGELLSSYTTDFGFSSEGRRHNVKLAASRINGTVIKEGEVFSFNGATGERTLENGYRESPTIEYGKYTVGVGGGACQVSTTLYNAVIRAGLKVVMVSPHSLPVSYVPPSMDAMVSSATDFRFFNNTPYPITIRSKVKGNSLTFYIYGYKMITDGEEIKYRTEVVERLGADYTEIIDSNHELQEGENFKIVKEAKDGLVSECYRETYYRGKLVSTVRIRRDIYQAQKGVKLVKEENQEQT